MNRETIKKLRDYQVKMVSRLEEAWVRYRSVMVQMPTGTGKTVLLAQVIRQRIGRINRMEEGCVLVVAHRRELIAQIKETLGRFGLNTNGIVVVESIQKLSNGQTRTDTDLNPSLVIIDEAHHAVAKTYRKLWEWWPEAKFLGLTATPCRLSGEAFTDLFDVLLLSEDIQWFIDRGYLSDFEYISAAPDSVAVRRIAALKKRGADGDYQTKEMATVMDTEESIAHLYDTYKAFCDGKKGIVYAISREHARHIAAYYGERDVRCAVIDSKTPAEERRLIVEAYKETCAIDVLVNCEIFGEGFDVPEMAFIQLARPTLSLSKYMQQVGRGMRVSEGKEQVTILDNAGLYLTFGFPTDSHDWRRMFLGMQTQVGRMTDTVRETFAQAETGTETEKELLSLQMVRIKHKGERKSGIEVFEENGKYGVKYDGRVTCIAKFDRIEPLKDSAYFAVASCRVAHHRQTRPYDIKTIIDSRGYDLHAGIRAEGPLEDVGNGFFVSTKDGTKTYWDVKTGRQYRRLPSVERFGYIEGLNTEEGDRYALRCSQKDGDAYYYFRREEVHYSRHLTIIRNLLIVNDRPNVVYRTYGYRKDQIIIIKSEWPREYQLVSLDGTFGRRMHSLGSTCVQAVSLGNKFLGKQTGGTQK